MTRATIDFLREKLAAFEPAASSEAIVATTGCEALDRMLPGGGWRLGSLVEWFSPAAGSGAMTLAVATMRQLWRQGSLVVIDRRREFFPPGVAAWGWPLDRTILVRPASDADERWAWEQALLSPGVAVVWGILDRLTPRDFRRLQLAAEGGHAVGFMFRPSERKSEPSWSHVGLEVRPRKVAGTRRVPSAARLATSHSNWPLTLQLIRGRASGNKQLELEIDEAGIAREVQHDERAISVRAVSELADPAARCLPT